MINGFEKAVVWTKEKVEAHAKKFSKSYAKSLSPWKSDFTAMALKTMVLQLIPKFGPMTIEMSTAMSSDMLDTKPSKSRIGEEITKKANTEPIDIEPVQPEPVEISKADMPPGLMTDEEKKAIVKDDIVVMEPDF